MIRLLLFLALAGALAAYTFWVYLRVELPVPRRRWLAALRAGAVVLLLALLFDPRVPWIGGGDDGDRWVLLDASASMRVAGGGGRSGWDAALARARELEGRGWRVVPFGGASDSASLDGLPQGTRSELAPALTRALESGASEVRVISDMRLQDRVAVAATVATSRVPVGFEPVGEATANRGVGGFELEDAARRGDTLRGSVEVFAESAGDSVTVEIVGEEGVLATYPVAAPAPGLRRRVPVRVPGPAEEGRVRLRARVVGSDAYPDDDEAVAWVASGYEEGAVVLVSARPDWEPRALLPVLGRVSGLRPVGFARIGPDRWLPIGRADGRGPAVDSATVRRFVEEAALSVIHGVSGADGGWLRSLAGLPARAVVWPADAGAAAPFGVDLGAARSGEWFVTPDLPPSPLAAELSGVVLQGLPPLGSLLGGGAPGPATVGLRAQLGGTGPGAPALLLVEDGERRTVLPLADGFWRWAARAGQGSTAYQALWSGVAGWLLEDAPRALPDVRPLAWRFEADEAVRFSVPAGQGPVRLTVARDGATVRDTALAGPGDATLGRLPPGLYAYEAVDGAGAPAGQGRFDVARASAEMAVPPLSTDGLEGGVPTAEAGRSGGGGVPLRTSPLPYLLVLVLLCVEWTFRRRAGLR